ncbi:hypothetical protein RRF57_012577 [Xylaria bambusicola]|uniref:DUF1776-domain-containing protein n=1 Tax=Xylaria bambusicola TaxID=326684 RepID=A0AAN7UY76_9PEZI
MSADDQQFWDLLSSVPNHVRQYSEGVADFLDKTVDKAADNVRHTLATASWVPDYARPKPSAPPSVPVVPMSTWETMTTWVSRHKVMTTVFVCVTGYVTYRAVRHSRLVRKSRRARRAKNGGRLEVVVIAGSPSLPLTKSLALDLERRGFLVYIVCNTIDDEVMVQNMSRPDIRGFSIDITDPPSAGASIDRFAAFLQTPHAAVPRAKPNYLTLTSIILIPSLHYQTSPIATIPPSNFADLFKTHLLQPILTIQAFLPLLTSRLAPPPQPQTGDGEGEKTVTEVPPTSTPKVLVFTPSIISSINPPFHAPEATVCSALSAFTEVLTAELRPLQIPVTHLQLGTFDFTGFVPARGPHNPGFLPPSAETQQWPEAARLAYARNYESQSSSAISAGRIRGLRGSSLRDLHTAVFDVLDGSDKSDVVRVGLGAGLYGFVGRWAPRGLVAWMMGIRKVDELSTWERPNSRSSIGSEDEEEPREYIAVGRGSEIGANVWKD